jgi:predicted adenylyl cyclase CyaB
MTEIEVKIRIDDPKAARDKAQALGAAITRDRRLEHDAFFDFAPPVLVPARRTLRLRVVGKWAALTFKGEPRKSRSFKVREESWTQVRDPKELRKILKALGLRETFAYRKHRTMLRTARLSICVDETAVGNFLELEGERHEIVRFARKLGYKRADFITLSYVEMLAPRDGAAGAD